MGGVLSEDFPAPGGIVAPVGAGELAHRRLSGHAFREACRGATTSRAAALSQVTFAGKYGKQN